MKHKINSSRSCGLGQLGRVLLVSILFSLACLTSPYGQQEEGYTPQWQVGDTWIIQTQYYPYQVSSDSVSTQATQWQFQVTEQNQQGYTVQVQNSEDPDVWMQLQVDQETMSIQGQEFHFVARNEAQVIRGEYPGQGMVPQFAQVGPVPCEMPFFPLAQQDSLVYQRDIRALEEIFEVTMIQQVRQTDDPAQIQELLAERLPERIRIPEVPRFFIVRTQQDVSQVEQVWAETLPWYLYSANDNSVSCLIETIEW